MFPSGSILWAECLGGCLLLADVCLSPPSALGRLHQSRKRSHQLPEGLHALKQHQDGKVDGDDHQQTGNHPFGKVRKCLFHMPTRRDWQKIVLASEVNDRVCDTCALSWTCCWGAGKQKPLER